MKATLMKTAKTAITLLLMVVINQSYGQLKDFRLSDYKLPELERSTLDFHFNLNGSGSKQNYPDNFSLQDRSIHNLQNAMGATYTYFLNSEVYQRRFRATLDFDYRFNQNKNDGNLQNKSASILPDFSIVSENRRYSMNERFVGYNMALRGGWYKHNRTELVFDKDCT